MFAKSNMNMNRKASFSKVGMDVMESSQSCTGVPISALKRGGGNGSFGSIDFDYGSQSTEANGGSGSGLGEKHSFEMDIGFGNGPVAVDGRFEGVLRWHPKPVQIDRDVIGLAEATYEEVSPSIVTRWTECHVVLDALHLNLYRDATMKRLIKRFDVLDLKLDLHSFGNGLFHFRDPHFLSKKLIIMDAGSDEAACKWVELLYQIGSMRMSWSLSNFPIIEQTLCGCMYGNHILEHLKWYCYWNILSSCASLIAEGFDMIDASGGTVESTKTFGITLDFLNDLMCLFASIWNLRTFRNHHNFEKALHKSKGVAWIFICLYICAIMLSIYYAYLDDDVGEDVDEVRHLVRKRLESFTDVLNLILWVNGLYLCQWGSVILHQDITEILQQEV